MLRKPVAPIVLLLLGLAVVSSYADEKQGWKIAEKGTPTPPRCYTLISGKSDAMCLLFEQNLNRFCDEPPMVCERKIHPDFANDFYFPDWEQVDPTTHMDIISDYIRARAPKYALCAENDEQCQSEWREKKWREYKTELLELMKAGQVKLSRAVMYIFGKKRLVYRLVDYPCSPSSEICWDSPQVPKLFAADDNTGIFDKEFTAIKSIEPFDVIFYKDQKWAYITEWEGGSPVLVSGRLRIDRSSFIACLFEYTKKNEQ